MIGSACGVVLSSAADGWGSSLDLALDDLGPAFARDIALNLTNPERRKEMWRRMLREIADDA